MLLWIAIMCLQSTRGQPPPDVISPGPASGIVLREQPGLLITNCRTHTQKVYVRLDPRNVYRAHYPRSATHYSWAGARWTETALDHAEADIVHMLNQLEKVTLTQAELSGHNRRSKRFLGALLGAAAAVGTLFNIGMSSVNAVNIATVRRHVTEIQTELPQLKDQLTTQSASLTTIGKTLRVGHRLMSDMLREVSSSMDNLAMGRIPPYLIPLSLVQTVLASATTAPTDPIQTHLAYSLGSAIPLYVDPTQREVGFLLNLPIIESSRIYRLKDIVNIGFWQRDTQFKVRTPDVVAYHDSDPQLYLAPNLHMCTRTKDIHYLCPSKPFLRDNTDGICGLQQLANDARCPADAKPRNQVTETQAEIVGNRWLVNTPVRSATLTYDQHDTATRVNLLNQSMWIQVPRGAILHLDDLALYHLPSEEYQAELEIPSFFKNRNFTLDPELEDWIEKGGPQVIDIAPLDSALQALSRLPILNTSPVVQTWTAADTALCITSILGHALALGLAYILYRRINAIRTSTAKLTEAVSVGFRRNLRKDDSPLEQAEDLIELTLQS
ncbi:hypothetical protein PO909_016886 [Leuciscus waleckii]